MLCQSPCSIVLDSVFKCVMNQSDMMCGSNWFFEGSKNALKYSDHSMKSGLNGPYAVSISMFDSIRQRIQMRHEPVRHDVWIKLVFRRLEKRLEILGP